MFDKVNSVDPTIKNKGFHYNHVESVKHDKKCPPTMVSVADEPTQVPSPALCAEMSMLTHTSRMQGGVEPRYTTESRIMSRWLPPVMPLSSECLRKSCNSKISECH